MRPSHRQRAFDREDDRALIDALDAQHPGFKACIDALARHLHPAPPAPLTTGQLAVWLDALTRQYGDALPLYVQTASVDAPAEVCLDARVQRGPSGERIVVLSAQALPRREEGHAAID